MALLDLFRQVIGTLAPSHGGTGSSYGEQRTVVKGTNSTGADIPLWTLVQWSAGANDTRLVAVTATSSTKVVGVVVGYYDGTGELVEDDAPDGFEVAVLTAGVVPILIESAVTRGQYAYAAATDGTISSSATAAAGAIGLVIESADTSSGATTARVSIPLATQIGGGGITGFATPSIALASSAAAGAATTVIRSDATIAAFDATSPVTQAFGDSAATGSAAFAARRDHRHGMPANPVSIATPSIVLGTAANIGAATTVIASDATIVAFDTTVPTTAAIGNAAATGSSAKAARRDHLHGMPAFATPSIALSSSAAAGSSADLIRKDATIAAFDSTVPVDQAFADTAATGSAAFAARRDHRHGMPASPSGTWSSEIIKSADEDVSNTTLQNDDELFTPTLVSNGFYEFEAVIYMASPVGGSAPDLKFSFGEDNTFRGYLFRVAGNAGTGTAEIVAGSVQQNQPLSAQTGTTPFGVYVRGSWVSGGGVFRLQWAQNTSNANATRVYAGSSLKYRRIA